MSELADNLPLKHIDPAVQDILERCDDLVWNVEVSKGEGLAKLPEGKLTLCGRTVDVTRARLETWLSVFADCGNVSQACLVSGLPRSTLNDLQQRYPQWVKLREEAREIAVDRLELEAMRRARDGVEEPIVQGGKIVTHVRKYSDKLMDTLLMANRKKFQKKVEHKVSGSVGITWSVDGVARDPAALAQPVVDVDSDEVAT